jgi:hypothetical protein
VAIHIGEDVLDEDLAPELLAEKADIAPDHGTEVEQHRRRARRQQRQELAQRFGREDRIVGDDVGAGSSRFLIGAPRRKTI